MWLLIAKTLEENSTSNAMLAGAVETFAHA